MNVSWAESSSALVEFLSDFRLPRLASALQPIAACARYSACSSLRPVCSCCVAAAASAVTLDQVVALAKAGVTDTVILALIDRDQTVFAIEPEQIVKLQRDGLSEQ